MFATILALLLQPTLGLASPFSAHLGKYEVIDQRFYIDGVESHSSGDTGTLEISEKPAKVDSSRAIVYFHHGKKGGWSGGGPLLPSSWSGSPIECVEKTDYIGCTSAEGTLTTTMVSLSDGRIVMATFTAGPTYFTKAIWELRRL